MTKLDIAIQQVDELLENMKLGIKQAPQQPISKESPLEVVSSQKPQTQEQQKETNIQDSGTLQKEDIELFDKICIKVGKVAKVDDVENSDKLYKVQVQIGENESRQICAGIKQYVPKERFENHLICVVYNLKTAKLAGQASEGMIMATEYLAPDGKTLVHPLEPPSDSEIGDQIFLQNGSISKSFAKAVKTDVFKKIIAGLRVQQARATFNNIPLISQKGFIVVPNTTPDGSQIK